MSNGPGEEPKGEHSFLCFSDFCFDRLTGELRHRGQPVSLRPQATRALRVLVEGRGRLVSREELRQALWGERHVDWQAGLHQHISQVRSALRECAGDNDIIETVSRRGYRIAGPVVSAHRDPNDGPLESPPLSNGSRMLWFALGGASALALPATFLILCSWLLAS